MAQLLVSVRSAAEARAALDGGAALVDVKEPSRGSLGRAEATVWAEVAAACGSNVAVSFALGEVDEHADGDPVPAVPPGAALVKLGLRSQGLAGRADWEDRWAAARERFDRAAGRPLPWVAVAYADARSASAPVRSR